MIIKIMEIDIGLFDKLVNISILDESNATKIVKDKSAVVLDRDTTSQLENGLLVSRYLEHTVGLMEQEKVNTNGADISKLAQLKEANTTSAKLFNWNIIKKYLMIKIIILIWFVNKAEYTNFCFNTWNLIFIQKL